MIPRAASLALLLLLLLVPATAAQPAGSSLAKVTTRLHLEDGITTEDRFEVAIQDANAFRANPVLRVHIDPDADTLTAVASTPNNTRPLDATRVRTVSETGDWKTYDLNLTGLFANITNGETITLTLTYSQDDQEFQGRLEYAASQIVVYATSDRDASSSELGAFAPTLNEGEQHAVRANAPAGYTYRVRFVQASGPASETDLNPYVMGVVGLLAGLLIAWFLFKRQPRSKRFEKGGEMESAAMLEARRRTLMAALKELELAHEAKEIPDAAYAPLKEEYKAQTVRVLRSLEDKKETPKT